MSVVTTKLKLQACYRRTGQFFLGGLSHLCSKNISTAPAKKLLILPDQTAYYQRAETVYIQWKVVLPDSRTHPITSKKPGFQALLDRMILFFFRLSKYKTNIFFSLLAAGFCPKNDGRPCPTRGLQPRGLSSHPCTRLIRLCKLQIVQGGDAIKYVINTI